MADPCASRKSTDGTLEVVVVVRVDNILVGTWGQAAMENFKDSLATKFKLKEVGEATLFRGCHIQRDRAETRLKVDQQVYLNNIVDRFNVSKTRSCRRLQTARTRYR